MERHCRLHNRLPGRNNYSVYKGAAWGIERNERERPPLREQSGILCKVAACERWIEMAREEREMARCKVAGQLGVIPRVLSPPRSS